MLLKNNRVMLKNNSEEINIAGESNREKRERR